MAGERPLLAQKGEILYLRVRAGPGARESRLEGIHGDALRVRVAAPPEKGAANRALCELLAGILGLRASQIEVASGQASRDKTIAISGISLEAAKKRLGLP